MSDDRCSSSRRRRLRSAPVYPAPRPAEAACRMPRATPLARSRRVQASATRDAAPARQPPRLRPRDSRDTTRPARRVPPRSSRRGGTRKPPRRRRAGRGSRTPRRATTEAGGGSPPRPSRWLAETHRQRRKARVCKLRFFSPFERRTTAPSALFRVARGGVSVGREGPSAYVLRVPLARAARADGGRTWRRRCPTPISAC